MLPFFNLSMVPLNIPGDDYTDVKFIVENPISYLASHFIACV